VVAITKSQLMRVRWSNVVRLSRAVGSAFLDGAGRAAARRAEVARQAPAKKRAPPEKVATGPKRRAKVATHAPVGKEAPARRRRAGDQAEG
jgi:hypothetical protein